MSCSLCNCTYKDDSSGICSNCSHKHNVIMYAEGVMGELLKVTIGRNSDAKEFNNEEQPLPSPKRDASNGKFH